MTIFGLLGVALLLFTLFRGIHYLLRPIVRRQNRWLRLSHTLYGVEFALWMVWLFQALNSVIGRSQLYPFVTVGLAFLLLIALSWFVLRDILAGIIFRLQHVPRINQSIRVIPVDNLRRAEETSEGNSHATGRIIYLGITSLMLENEVGEQIKMPYSRVVNQSIAQYEASEYIKSYEFSLQLPKSKPKDKWVHALRQQILLLPWSSTKQSPVIQWRSENDQCYIFDILVYSLSTDYALQIESYLTQQYSSDSKK
ncbi:mechanosensitive ion channel [Tunicatimonas pelagia]|uniref:mechanosensitive ion channel n=1 Tax=Tunicatimonas pelagia TaxID=931531 RepID=UPI002665B0AF|nr:mechanosensitive ion channel [Tunicatimonas pelagia]WKN43111.1 mechanosensitive ion channel [Tunicatimonas pelagia]